MSSHQNLNSVGHISTQANPQNTSVISSDVTRPVRRIYELLEITNESIDFIESRVGDAVEIMGCLDVSLRERIKSLCEMRSALDIDRKRAENSILEKKKAITLIDSTITAKRSQVAKILNGEVAESGDMQSTMNRIKEEVREMHLRLELGLNELNRRSHTAN